MPESSLALEAAGTVALPLALAADGLLDLLLVRTPGIGTLGLGGLLLAGRSLEFLSFGSIFDVGCVHNG